MGAVDGRRRYGRSELNSCEPVGRGVPVELETIDGRAGAAYFAAAT